MIDTTPTWLQPLCRKVAHEAIEKETAMNLHKLATPALCGCEYLRNNELITCRQPAQWSVDGTPVCDEDMHNMAEMNSDNAAFFAPALSQPTKPQEVTAQ